VEQEEIKKISGKIGEIRRLLEEVGETRFEGVNANVRKAMISIRQALYDLGEEEDKEV